VKSRGPIIRPSKDVDEYVVWSTIAEGPVFVGDRAAVLRFLGPGEAGYSTLARLHRAAVFGTSNLDRIGGWGDSLIYDQRGSIACARLGELARRVAAGDIDGALDLCEPFDGETEVRRPTAPKVEAAPLVTVEVDWVFGFGPAGAETAWRCQHCRALFQGHHRLCPRCAYTVFDPMHRKVRT
jgi:hypothetical protein